MSVFEDKQLAERFMDPAPLGQGSFLYKSFVARDKQTDSFVLLKVLSKALLGGGAAEGAVAAARALSDPAVPGTLHLLEALETDGHVVLVHEYLGGGDLLARCGKWRVTEEDAKTIFMQLLRPVAALHERGRAHGEVRADNVFFGTPLHAFLGDAGVSALFGPAAVRAALLAVPQHAAPELIEQNRRHEPPTPLQPSSDIWGLGLVLFTMLSGTHPFAGRSFDDILSAHVMFDQPRWKSYSHGARLLVLRLLVRDPAQRPAAALLLADPWLAGVQPPPPADPAFFVRVPPPPRARETVELPPEPEPAPARQASAAAAAAVPSKQRSTAASTKRAREESEAAPVAAVAGAAPEKKTKEAPPAETEESLSALTVVILKARCKELGLAQGGRKAELVARILAHLAE